MLSLAKTFRCDIRSAPVSRCIPMMMRKPAGDAPPMPLQRSRFGVLQRKYACGGTCPQCRPSALPLQAGGLEHERTADVGENGHRRLIRILQQRAWSEVCVWCQVCG